MRENIVGNTDESILFSKHPAILTDKRQTVNIRVNNDTKVVTALCHLVHNAGEVLLQWLRIVGKVTISLSIKDCVCYTELVEKLWQDYSTNAIDRVNDDTEASLADRLCINEFQCEYAVYVTLVKGIILRIFSYVINVRIVEILLLGNR